MRLPEQKFWDRTRRALAPQLHIERVENLVDVGTPDLLVLAPTNVVTPTELKAALKWPARSTTRVLSGSQQLNVDQKNWHLTWQQNGGRSAILVGVGSTEQFLFSGKWGDDLNDMTEAQMRANGLSDWRAILEWLKKGNGNEN